MLFIKLYRIYFKLFYLARWRGSEWGNSSWRIPQRHPGPLSCHRIWCREATENRPIRKYANLKYEVWYVWSLDTYFSWYLISNIYNFTAFDYMRRGRPRQYWMIYRWLGFLALAWFGSLPFSFPLPLSRQQVFSLSQFSCVSPVELMDGRERGWGRSQIQWPRDSLVLYKSFNSHWGDYPEDISTRYPAFRDEACED